MSANIPVKITSPGAGMVRTETLFVKKVRWVGATTGGHAVEIQDSASNTLWASTAAGANYVESDWIEEPWESGFKVPTLDSGTLYVYVSRGKTP